MKIKNITVREIFNSRGETTIEVCLENEKKIKFFSEIPGGKSRGSNEAIVFSYARVKKVLERGLVAWLKKNNFNSIKQFDSFLLKQDNTKNKGKLGGNLTLGLSLAFSRALAFERKQEIWQMLQAEFFPSSKLKANKIQRPPLIFSNLINGGAHSNNNLDIQEYLVVVKAQRPLADSIRRLIDFYQLLGQVLRKKYKTHNLPLGDEGGYDLNFQNNLEPLLLLGKLIKKHRLGQDFNLAIDAAASTFYQNSHYFFENKKISRQQLQQVYLDYFKKAKGLLSIEDPFYEKDFAGFQELKKAIGEKWIVGDDVTATSPSLIEKGATEKLINAVIIKPNQIGTVTETCQAIETARRHKIKIIVSHRSGETEDNFIIHLAKASAAEAVKIGAPVHERILKFNELIRLYE